MERSASSVIARCSELKNYWSPRDEKMKRWYRMIEMIDELKTDNMESFVGNDPRALYNLVLHLLDSNVPHRIKDINSTDPAVNVAAGEVTKFFQLAWKDAQSRFRRSNPRQGLQRTSIGFMLATGWYADFAIISDNGDVCYDEPWNPIEVYPMWDFTSGLSEVAHIYKVSTSHAINLAKINGWNLGGYKQWRSVAENITMFDYWWVDIDDEFPFAKSVWNAIVVDTTLVKFMRTRFKRIPIYTAPVGGLPDMGSLTEGALPTYSSTLKLHTQEVSTDRWKAELGQAIIATNENIYKTWNKWWSFSLQLLRDTAQPRVFERSRSGKAIVRPEDIFRRGAIFRGGVDDAVDFIGAPPIPLELRTTQLDLEAMMQRGGVSWSMYGNVQGQLSAYVMSQIAASANQVMKPFHQAVIDKYEDIDNDWLEDIKNRSIRPYGWKYPKDLPEGVRVSADYDVEIPGDLVQRATTARMLDPDFRLSYTYVSRKLFPDIEDPLRERAQVLADQAMLHPSNSLIALVQHYRQQASYLYNIGDENNAKLYEAVAEATLGVLMQQQQPTPEQPISAGRAESVPQRVQLPERTNEGAKV